MTLSYEADLDPESFAPRIRLNFDNGWSVSIVFTSPDANGTRFSLASIAACPTGKWGQGCTELLHNEAFADELADILRDVGKRPSIKSGGAA